MIEVSTTADDNVFTFTSIMMAGALMLHSVGLLIPEAEFMNVQFRRGFWA
jgi:hypothetical protein